MKKKEGEGDDYGWLHQKKYPVGIGLMVDYILKLVDHRKPIGTATPQPETVVTQEAIENYRAFFPGFFVIRVCNGYERQTSKSPLPCSGRPEHKTCFSKSWAPLPQLQAFMQHGNAPAPWQDLLLQEETTIPYLDSFGSTYVVRCDELQVWELGYKLRSKRWSTPIALTSWCRGGIPSPSKVHLWPISPPHRCVGWCGAAYHKAYVNGKFVSEKLHGKLGIVHSRKAETYLSRSPKRRWISYDAFTGGITPPTPALIRTHFQETEHSTLMLYGFLNLDRHEREMQSVSLSAKDEKVAFDWTFQTTKNYNLPGANAVFTGNKGTTEEIITLTLVPTTAASQISHLLLQSKEKQKSFKPAVIYIHLPTEWSVLEKCIWNLPWDQA
jgi:hypothetical protein